MSHKYTPEERIAQFWSKVDRSRGPNGCWEWVGSTINTGYGVYKYNGRFQVVHRISWQLKYGPIPEGLKVCHWCDNRRCVNPAHLWLGTQQQNIADMVRKERMARGERIGINKLSQQQALEIRRRFAHGGLTFRGLAREYGVSDSTISNIVRRKTFRYI